MARELADRDVHAEADPEVGHAVLARVARRLDLALEAAAAEAAGDQDAVGVGEPRGGGAAGQRLGVDPVDLDPAAVAEAGVAQRLGDRQVGVLELDVLADDRDPHPLVGLARRARRASRQPSRSAARRVEAEVLEHEVVDALALEGQRALVDVRDVVGRDDRLDRQAREQRDLLADVGRQRRLRAADEHVGLDADPPQLVDRVLRRLRLQLAGVVDVGHERQVDEHAAPPADVDRELADRLEERQRLDVADGAADLGDHEVDVGRLGDQRDPLLDLVGDVRHDLDGRAEVVAAALAADHGVVDAAGGDVRGARRVGVGEALVVAEVEVGLGAVLGDEHLAVLVGRHRARVDVDVGVELLQRDGQPARDQQLADRGGGDALAERGDDAAGDEDEPRAVRTVGRLWHQGVCHPV